MAVTLNGIALSGSMQLVERYSAKTGAMSFKRTLGGKFRVYAAPVFGGREAALVSTEETGWIDYTTVQAIENIAHLVGDPMELVYHNETYMCVIDHSKVPYKFTPLIVRAIPLSTDMFYGEINLVLL
ncbi:hypothetical protein E6Q11_05625 [Candidatus Dojkabacteria bacterium]|uniref:Uncharacterized protein n=1 Tax=Candidatus Dojkabacteria bacterium TaxID=2099670 RepID=A0A5C7J533_9BACT|nr:MAG: hypothetical protein E6Q11_05625 [Candidatus Dojkabacteria bacterium]